MAREPVAIDFIGLGERGHVGLMGSSTHGSAIDDERVSRVATRLVRPVPSVPEYHHLANTQVMSRIPPVSEGFRNWTDNRADNAGTNSPFARPGAAGDHLISSLSLSSIHLVGPTITLVPKHSTPPDVDAFKKTTHW